MIKLLWQFKSKKDRICKWVFENENEGIIELSLISNKNQDILYVPTHYNCPLGCRECSLSSVFREESLKPISYDDLMEAIGKTLLDNDTRITTNTKILVSFRGVGEPLLNMPLLKRMIKEKYSLEIFGYNNVGFEISTIMPNENLKALLDPFVHPVRIIYRLSSPCDTTRETLEPSTTLSVDGSLSYLKKFNDSVIDNLDEKKKFKSFFGRKNPTEIRYSIKSGVNDSLFELANLQYFQNRFNIPIVFLKNNNGEEEWIADILSHYENAELSIQRASGRDLGVEHGEFDVRYYSKTSNAESPINPSHQILNCANNVQTKKKVLDNKVV
ncbi:MAG: hypothetical protein K2G03_06170 [Bacilli bacterium]|nr:hypothetical protein [Bacilli bacterium]